MVLRIVSIQRPSVFGIVPGASSAFDPFDGSRNSASSSIATVFFTRGT